MLCDKCGNNNADDSKFCQYCGSALIPPAPQPEQSAEPIRYGSNTLKLIKINPKANIIINIKTRINISSLIMQVALCPMFWSGAYSALFLTLSECRCCQ